MKTTVSNKFHNFTKIITHRGNLPSLSSLQKAFRAAKPSDCVSPTTAYREDECSRSLSGLRLGQRGERGEQSSSILKL